MRKRVLALAGIAFIALASGPPITAESRSAALAVRVTVVRSCAVDTGVPGADGGVAVTCTRGATTQAGVASTMAAGTRTVTRVVPIPARQMTIVASRPALLAAMRNLPTSSTAPRQLVTLNF
jgi:hypothetical protein